MLRAHRSRIKFHPPLRATPQLLPSDPRVPWPDKAQMPKYQCDMATSSTSFLLPLGVGHRRRLWATNKPEPLLPPIRRLCKAAHLAAPSGRPLRHQFAVHWQRIKPARIRRGSKYKRRFCHWIDLKYFSGKENKRDREEKSVVGINKR